MEGGVVGQPLLLERGYPSGVGARPTPAKHNNTRAGRPLPSEHQGFGQVISCLYGMASTSTSSCRGSRHSILLSMPVTVVYSR